MIIEELQKPAKILIEEIILDLNKIKRGYIFTIPHIDGERVIDQIHKFERKSYEKPTLTRKNLDTALLELENKEYGSMVGLVAHLVYWIVFGHVNACEIDVNELKKMFSIVQLTKSNIEQRYIGLKKF